MLKSESEGYWKFKLARRTMLREPNESEWRKKNAKRRRLLTRSAVWLRGILIPTNNSTGRG
jgi:hypothetical protein